MKTTLKIAYIDDSKEMGGAQLLLLKLIPSLPINKVSSILFCPGLGSFSKRAAELGIRTTIVKFPKYISTSWLWKGKKIFNPFAVAIDLILLLKTTEIIINLLKTQSIDFIQTNSFFSHICGGMAAKFLNIPCIWYYHDLVENKRMMGIPARIISFLSNIFPSWIIADSQSVLDAINSKKPGMVIYPGVEPVSPVQSKNFLSIKERLSLPNSTVLVGFLGRIAHVKGLDILIKSASIVNKQCSNIHLIIFGETFAGEEKYKKMLDDLIVNNNLSSTWHWMGYDRYAKEYLYEMDFIVCPSRREAFGLVLVEAGFCGKAVIASSIGGIPEIICNQVTGILVQPENKFELSQSILHLAQNTQYAKNIGANARNHVKNIFSFERYLEEFINFYNNIENKHPIVSD